MAPLPATDDLAAVLALGRRLGLTVTAADVEMYPDGPVIDGADAFEYLHALAGE